MKSKSIVKIASLMAVLVFAAGCFKDPEFKPAEIGLDRNTLELEKEASQTVLKILSNRDWKVEITSSEGRPDWLKVSDTVGTASSDSVSLTLSALQNDGSVRYATVNFRTATVYASVSVMQKGAAEKQYTPISAVRDLYKGSNVKIGNDVLVKGTVISNYRAADKGGLNNSTSLKNMIISDETAGISLRMTANNEIYAPGDVVEVRLDGLSLERYQDGSLQVNGLPKDNIVPVPFGTGMPEPIQITAAQLLTGDYESRYVAVSDVQVTESDMGKTFVTDKEKHSNIYFESKDAKEFVLFSSRYSSYGDQKVPTGSGVLKGIAMVFGGNTYQISITSLEDLAGLTGERFSSGTDTPSGDGKLIGDYNKWNAVGPLASFKDDFSSVTEAKQEYWNDNWLFWSSDGSDVSTGWKTGVYKEELNIDIAPYKSKSEVVTAYALMPRMDVSAADPKVLKFKKKWFYLEDKGSDGTKLEVVVSRNFTGDFNTADWTVVQDASMAAGTSMQEWIQETVDLSGYSAEKSLSIAIRYTGHGDTYRLDDVQFGEGKSVPSFSVRPLSATVEAAAGSFEIDVLGNVDWTASSSDAENFKVSPASGSGTGKVKVEYTENVSETEQRTAKITIVTSDAAIAEKTQVCEITQKVKGAAAGGEFTSNVDIQSNVTPYLTYAEEVIVEGTTYPCLKMGTGNKPAQSYVTPALPRTGEMELSLYAVAWKGKSSILKVSVVDGGTINGTQSIELKLNDNSNASNKSPYTIDFTDGDFYTAKLSGITSGSRIKFECSDRTILTGVNVK